MLHPLQPSPPQGTRLDHNCIGTFSGTDFRADLRKFTIPTRVTHGDSDVIVPFEVSGKRTAAALPGAKVAMIKGGPHGVNASHPDALNRSLLAFLA